MKKTFFMTLIALSISGMLTMTDFTLHFSCFFTKLLHSHFIPLLNNFTISEKCY